MMIDTLLELAVRMLFLDSRYKDVTVAIRGLGVEAQGRHLDRTLAPTSHQPFRKGSFIYASSSIKYYPSTGELIL